MKFTMTTNSLQQFHSTGDKRTYHPCSPPHQWGNGLHTFSQIHTLEYILITHNRWRSKALPKINFTVQEHEKSYPVVKSLQRIKFCNTLTTSQELLYYTLLLSYRHKSPKKKS